MRRRQHSSVRTTASIVLLITSMMLSIPRGASSAILASVRAGRSRTGRRAHHDVALHRRRGSSAFLGSYSSTAVGDPCTNYSLACQQPFLSTSILQQLRGGGSSRNNSTSSSNDTTDGQQTWRKAYVAVGSNMGDTYHNIATALSSLEEAKQNDGTTAVRVLRTSYLRMTAPMYVTDQAAFLNGAVEIETTLSPLELLRALKRVESYSGRDIGPNSTALRFGPRPVDLDILLFDGYEVTNPDGTMAETLEENDPVPNSVVMHTEILEIPHPRMAEREFVLAPMSDLERKDDRITHPVFNKSMSELLNSLLSQTNHTDASDEEEQAVRVLPLPRGRMLPFNRTIIMGVLNVTPDSFSDGGKFNSTAELAASQAIQLEKDGADIVDVGGESTRPGAEEVAVQEELERVIPVIARIRQESDVPISIDTRHAIVAKAAIEAGADIVNDVSGGAHDPEMYSCVASLGVPMIIMHMRGNPKTMQSLTNYGNKREDGNSGSDGGGGVVSGVARELMQRSAAAEAAGIPLWLQVVDPGIGFAKDIDGNLALMNGVDTLRQTCKNMPFLFGPSRKGFIGKITGESDPEERDYGTIAACLASIQSGNNDGENSTTEACNMLRVHNVRAVKQAVLVYEAIRNAKQM